LTRVVCVPVRPPDKEISSIFEYIRAYSSIFEVFLKNIQRICPIRPVRARCNRQACTPAHPPVTLACKPLDAQYDNPTFDKAFGPSVGLEVLDALGFDDHVILELELDTITPPDSSRVNVQKEVQIPEFDLQSVLVPKEAMDKYQISQRLLKTRVESGLYRGPLVVVEELRFKQCRSSEVALHRVQQGRCCTPFRHLRKTMERSQPSCS
jgi:hypothetical protein